MFVMKQVWNSSALIYVVSLAQSMLVTVGDLEKEGNDAGEKKGVSRIRVRE